MKMLKRYFEGVVLFGVGLMFQVGWGIQGEL